MQRQARKYGGAFIVLLGGYVPAQTNAPVRADNHTANAAKLLREAGIACSWTYLSIKVGYGKYDEGLAMLSLNREISHVESFLISCADDYSTGSPARCWACRSKA